MPYSFIIIGLWIVFLAFWFISAMSAKKGAAAHGRSATAYRIFSLLAIFAILQIPQLRNLWTYQFPKLQNPAVALAGTLLCAAGIAFAIWARVHLGKNWGMPMTLREDHQLITTGPYRIVRHPIYTGAIFAMLGSALAAGTSYLVLFIYLLVYFIIALHIEEKDMLKQFPDYAEYKKRTKALIPFII